MYTTETFIKKAKKVHKDKYDYSYVVYSGSKNKVKILCKKHNFIFEQSPAMHLQGNNCPKCGGNKFKLTTKEFIEKAIDIHGNRYDYSLTEYIDWHEKIKIICKEHGIFESSASGHIHDKNGCPECMKQFLHDKFASSKEDFMKKAHIVHEYKYDYSLVEYKNYHTNIEIICNIHGIFVQEVGNHLSGKGCPKCKSSLGEKRIREFLQENNINFEEQKRFEECKDRHPLPFDFYLNERDIFIEFHGSQHYKENLNFFSQKQFF